MPAYLREVCSVSAKKFIALDFNEENGKRAGYKWLCTLTQEDGKLLGCVGCNSTSIDDPAVSGLLKEVAARDNVDVDIVIIDNLAKSGKGKVVNSLEKIFSATHVLQVLLHIDTLAPHGTAWHG